MGRYTRAPEPYRDPPPPQPPRCGAQNPLQLAREQSGDLSTEFSWGPGPIAPHLNGRPPSEGGKYMPRAPRVDPPVSGVGRPRQHMRPPGEVQGYPGEQASQ